MYDSPYFYAQGWVCPICKNVYSPSTLFCYNCNSQPKWYPVTCDSASTSHPVWDKPIVTLYGGPNA